MVADGEQKQPGWKQARRHVAGSFLYRKGTGFLQGQSLVLHGPIRGQAEQERTGMAIQPDGGIWSLFREFHDRQERPRRAFLQGHRHDRQAHGQGVQQQVPSDIHRASPLHEIGSRLQQFLRVLDL